jgi:hypothetical protein
MQRNSFSRRGSVTGHGLALRFTLGLAGLMLALICATASAFAGEPLSSCEKQWVATYGVPAPNQCEEQALASRGTGAPNPATAPVSDVPRADSPDSGFDWGSAAIGAGAVAGLFALGTLGAMALDRRSRVRTAG